MSMPAFEIESGGGGSDVSDVIPEDVPDRVKDQVEDETSGSPQDDVYGQNDAPSDDGDDGGRSGAYADYTNSLGGNSQNDTPDNSQPDNTGSDTEQYHEQGDMSSMVDTWDEADLKDDESDGGGGGGNNPFQAVGEAVNKAAGDTGEFIKRGLDQVKSGGNEAPEGTSGALSGSVTAGDHIVGSIDEAAARTLDPREQGNGVVDGTGNTLDAVAGSAKGAGEGTYNVITGQESLGEASAGAGRHVVDAATGGNALQWREKFREQEGDIDQVREQFIKERSMDDSDSVDIPTPAGAVRLKGSSISSLASANTLIRTGTDALVDNPAGPNVQDAGRQAGRGTLSTYNKVKNAVTGSNADTQVDNDDLAQQADNIESDFNAAANQAGEGYTQALEGSALEGTPAELGDDVVGTGFEWFVGDPIEAVTTASTGIDPETGKQEQRAEPADLYEVAAIGVGKGAKALGLAGDAVKGASKTDEIAKAAAKGTDETAARSSDEAAAKTTGETSQAGSQTTESSTLAAVGALLGSPAAVRKMGIFDELATGAVRSGDDAAGGADEFAGGVDDVGGAGGVDEVGGVGSTGDFGGVGDIGGAGDDIGSLDSIGSVTDQPRSIGTSTDFNFAEDFSNVGSIADEGQPAGALPEGGDAAIDEFSGVNDDAIRVDSEVIDEGSVGSAASTGGVTGRVSSSLGDLGSRLRGAFGGTDEAVDDSLDDQFQGVTDEAGEAVDDTFDGTDEGVQSSVGNGDSSGSLFDEPLSAGAGTSRLADEIGSTVDDFTSRFADEGSDVARRADDTVDDTVGAADDTADDLTTRLQRTLDDSATGADDAADEGLLSTWQKIAAGALGGLGAGAFLFGAGGGLGAGDGPGGTNPNSNDASPEENGPITGPNGNQYKVELAKTYESGAKLLSVFKDTQAQTATQDQQSGPAWKRMGFAIILGEDENGDLVSAGSIAVLTTSGRPTEATPIAGEISSGRWIPKPRFSSVSQADQAHQAFLQWLKQQEDPENNPDGPGPNNRPGPGDGPAKQPNVDGNLSVPDQVAQGEGFTASWQARMTGGESGIQASTILALATQESLVPLAEGDVQLAPGRSDSGQFQVGSGWPAVQPDDYEAHLVIMQDGEAAGSLASTTLTVTGEKSGPGEPGGGGPGEGGPGEDGWGDAQMVRELKYGWYLFAQVKKGESQETRFMLVGKNGEGTRIYIQSGGQVDTEPKFYPTAEAAAKAYAAWVKRHQNGNTDPSETPDPEQGRPSPDGVNRDAARATNSGVDGLMSRLTSFAQENPALATGGAIAVLAVGYYGYENGWFDGLTEVSL